MVMSQSVTVKYYKYQVLLFNIIVCLWLIFMKSEVKYENVKSFAHKRYIFYIIFLNILQNLQGLKSLNWKKLIRDHTDPQEKKIFN